MDCKIALIDDREEDRAYLTALVRRWGAERGHRVALSAFPSAEAFLFRFEEEKDFGVLLLDIEMDGMNGVELAKKVRETDETVQIVFVTGFSEFLSEGYEVSALHYLLKPIDPEKLFTVLDRAADRLAKAEKSLAVTFDRHTEYLPLSRICYVESQKQYVLIHTDEKIFRMRTTLAEVEEKLDEYFCKCQRSFLVNLRHVAQIRNDRVVLKNGETVPISRGMAEKIGREIIRLF